MRLGSPVTGLAGVRVRILHQTVANIGGGEGHTENAGRPIAGLGKGYVAFRNARTHSRRGLIRLLGGKETAALRRDGR